MTVDEAGLQLGVVGSQTASGGQRAGVCSCLQTVSSKSVFRGGAFPRGCARSAPTASRVAESLVTTAVPLKGSPKTVEKGCVLDEGLWPQGGSGDQERQTEIY